MRPIFAVSRRFREPGLRKRSSSPPCRDVSLARRTGRVEQLAAGYNDTIAIVKTSSCACSNGGEASSRFTASDSWLSARPLLPSGSNGETIRLAISDERNSDETGRTFQGSGGGHAVGAGRRRLGVRPIHAEGDAPDG